MHKQLGVMLLVLILWLLTILLLMLNSIRPVVFDPIQHGPGNIRCIMGYKFVVNGRGDPVQALGPNGRGVPCPQQHPENPKPQK